MIEQVTKPTIGALLSPEESIMFKIPRYQREYTWGHRDWENLFDDLMDNQEGYFLGSIIVIDHGRNPEVGITECEVIDGQQRLTTVSILLASLCQRLTSHKVDFVDDDEILNTYLNLKNRLILKKKKGRTRLVPQVQSGNLADYRALLVEAAGLDSKELKPSNAGNRRIYKAFRYFDDRIAEAVKDEVDVVDTYCRLLQKVISAVVVQISVSTHSDAYVLFESLNNRGIPLTAVDLIKNSLLANLKVQDEDELDAYFDQWQNMLALLGDDYKTQERFFRHGYDAYRRKVNEPFVDGDAKFPLGAVATKSNLLAIYERQIKRDPEAMLDELVENANIYSQVTQVSSSNASDLDEALFDLANVQGVASYLMLLWLMRNQAELRLSDEQLASICHLTTRFFVRRNLTDTPPTRQLTQLFIRIVEEVEDSKATGDAVFNIAKKRLASVSASDSVFEQILRGSVYELNPDTTRFILAALAKPSVTKEMKGLWERYKSGTYVWTIEHVFPQGKNIPDSWVDMIAGGDYARAEQLQDQYVHTMGNLTLTGYNSTLSNLSFEEKKNRKDKDGNPVGYLNGLNINADIASKNAWTIAAIQARTDLLVSQAVNLFTL